MATIRDRDDLWRVMMEKLRPVIGFDDAVVIALSEDQCQYCHFLTASSPERKANANYSSIVGPMLPIAGTPNAYLLTLGSPYVWHTEEMLEKFPDDPGVHLCLETGLNHCVGFRLHWSNRLLGLFQLAFSRREQLQEAKFPLYKSVADQVAVAVANILANEEVLRLQQQLQRENVYLAEEIRQTLRVGEMIGSSPCWQQVLHQLSLVAPTDSAVLILGETGTGKELIARAIHEHSSRKGKVLVKVNCAALPRELIESELFGHERGAFTGALQQRVGKFELAKDGTIFLDEIGELPLELQAKLLRVLQEKEIERLGSNKTIRCNARVITATNRDLEKEVSEGRFRMDLYYRLNVFPIYLPPLRERKEDIPQLAAYFGQKFSQRMGKPFLGIRQKAMQELFLYHWPGNIRELENLVEQAVIVSQDKPLEWARKLSPGKQSPGSPPSEASLMEQVRHRQEDLEREQLLAVLRQTKAASGGKKAPPSFWG